ncbi:MAG: hypothetical protein LUF87_01255 [Alistipes sp.]|nr:hypothetical protein [Alistipes sp.]
MKTFNEHLLEDLVSTKYGDMSGLIQIDGHDNILSLYKLCDDHGIDTDHYFLIGFGISDFSLRGLGENGIAFCHVFLLEKSKYANTYDEIQKIFIDNPSVSVIKKSFTVKYTDLGKYIKRLNTFMLTSLADNIEKLEVIEE